MDDRDELRLLAVEGLLVARAEWKEDAPAAIVRHLCDVALLDSGAQGTVPAFAWWLCPLTQ